MKAHDCRQELRAAGSRVTPGRLALLELLERVRQPLSAAEIGERLPRINQVTVYRALDTLVAAGLVRKGTRNRVAYFEYAGKPHHHHLVCADCGFNRACLAC